MAAKVGERVVIDVLGHPDRGRMGVVIWKSKNPFNLRKRYLVRMDDGHEVLTGRAMKLPKQLR